MEFSQKQKEYILNANKRWNIKSGATRSGKTYLDYTYTIPSRIRERINLEGLVVILGVTKETIERNVLMPMRKLYGEGLVGTIDNRNRCKLFGESVYCLGAEKSNQVSKIRGASIKYCYGDELTEWSEEVFELLKSRLDKPYSVFDGACNPKYPTHFVKRFLESGADIYEQDYTIFDNPFLDPIVVENLCKEYEGTVYYDRYIKGLWRRAEGVIYQLFADNPSRYIVDKVEPLQYVTIGVDYGASMGRTVFQASGFGAGFRNIYALKQEVLEETFTPDQINIEFAKFIRNVINTYGKAQYVFADWGGLGQVLTRGLKQHIMEQRINTQIQDCEKGSILERIELTQILMAQDRLKIVKGQNEALEDALSEAIWNEKVPDERLDDGSTDIDSLDAFEYSIYPFSKNIIQYFKQHQMLTTI
jgi:PBSX family phage terminase large subunit